jgi:3',5'-cyclic AMP phosphodiesterase CpdA
MRTLVQISDLHFGRVDPSLLDPLAAAVDAIGPDVLVVSGDLTQRARNAQFRAARAFLDRLPMPQVVVPGNHDVPLYDVVRRFVAPLARFRRYIERDPAPFFRDDHVAVLGINSARSLTFKGGRINHEQIETVRARFGGLDPAIIRVLVTHHPFELPPDGDEDDLIGRGALAMQAFAECGVDVLLSGHLHRSHSGSTTRYRIDNYAALVVQAGTASSTRGRGEANAFNVIRIERPRITHPRITVEAWSWQPPHKAFALERSDTFRRGAEGWARD